MYKINDKAIAFLPIESIEKEALQQIENTSKMPFLFKHVAVMPDCHMGKGATVGTVIATKKAIIPAAVGVDIGCGMISVKTNLRKENLKDLHEIRLGIERRIPMSAGKFNTKITETAQKRIDELNELSKGRDLNKEFGTTSWEMQLGTLGGGNHFIEVCLDEEDTVWLTVHSGSRGIGNKIGMSYITKAQKLMKEMFITLPDIDLAYLVEGTEEFENYLRDLHWAQRFAMLNREEMMDRFITEIKYHVYGNEDTEIEVERINCHHNFSQIENHFGENVWVTRKGAIQVKEGMKGMIPGSMGTKSYIVEGKGNKMAFESSPHGAGRKFSRAKARQEFTMEDFKKQMIGIEHRESDILLDEIPSCYKDIDEVMENAKDLVEIKHTLKQIVNVKGD
jgi:tRNA-splicing ligase RtcB